MPRSKFASLLRILGFMVLLTVVGAVLLYVLVGRGPAVPSNARLTLRISGDLAEMAPDNVVSYVSGGRAASVRTIVDNLRKAAVDPRVRSVLLRPAGVSTPYWGKIQEIRDAVVAFKKSGKPVYAYLEYGGDRDYYLATAADKVFLLPSSPLDVTGVATYQVFLRGTLDTLGVVADLHGIGPYKTAPNQFTEKSYTATHREMDTSLNRDLYEQVIHAIAEGRKKSDDEVKRLLDEGPFLPAEAVLAGLIDGPAYEDEVVTQLDAASANGAENLEGEDYADVSARSVGLNKGPRVAVIYVAGEIVGGRSGFDPLNGAVVGADTLIEYIRRIRKDASLRAIILRIDSPGGSASASDAIWRELMLARKERPDRPIVVSMSDLAASGGYYIALPAEAIVAQPATLTGSIGVYGGKFATGGIYEKVGGHVDAVSDGKNAQMNSPLRPYNPAERAALQKQLQAFYDDFVKKVAESRKSTPEKIDRLAQGRVWTGRQALQNGLVDALGGLPTAVRLAKERAKIDASSDVEVVVYPPTRSFYELLTDQVSGASGDAAIGSWVSRHLSSAEVDLLRAARPLSVFRSGEPLALMPETLVR